MSLLKIAIVQMDIQIGKPKTNMQVATSMIREASASKPDVVVLPELWNTGYALDRIHDLCDHDGQDTKRVFSDLSRELGVWIVAGSIADKRAGKVYNTSYVFDRTGSLTSTYSKVHLFQLMDEHRYLAPGEDYDLWTLDKTPCTQLICYDLRFPELLRSMALSGAQIAFIPAEWPNPRLVHWRQLQIARAIENQMFIVSCNRVGTSGDTTFFGHSMVVDPWGEILLEGDDQPGIHVVDIDLGTVADIRNRIPIFQDRRPEAYRLR